MTDKKDPVKSTVRIEFLSSGRVIIDIKNFEKITPGRLEQALQHTITHWGRLRAQAVNERRKREKEVENA